jgi:RimJ/RimL family protein N-acetyltransferase
MRLPIASRLTFREMTDADLDDMAALLGDKDVMRFYPRPMTRSEARDWIARNQRRYRDRGFGLWIINVRDSGEFVGDCGLTLQPVDGVDELEVGYHVRTSMQGQGYATEAAAASRDFARDVRTRPRQASPHARRRGCQRYHSSSIVASLDVCSRSPRP